MARLNAHINYNEMLPRPKYTRVCMHMCVCRARRRNWTDAFGKGKSGKDIIAHEGSLNAALIDLLCCTTVAITIAHGHVIYSRDNHKL